LSGAGVVAGEAPLLQMIWLAHYKSQGKLSVLRFPLTISVKYIFSKIAEGLIETEKKFRSHELIGQKNSIWWQCVLWFRMLK